MSRHSAELRVVTPAEVRRENQAVFISGLNGFGAWLCVDIHGFGDVNVLARVQSFDGYLAVSSAGSVDADNVDVFAR